MAGKTAPPVDDPNDPAPQFQLYKMDELRAENDRLRTENADLTLELERVSAELDRVKNNAAPDAAADDSDPAAIRAKAPTEPSFGMSEGTREELERTGKATSPFTGKTITKDDKDSEAAQ